MKTGKILILTLMLTLTIPGYASAEEQETGLFTLMQGKVDTYNANINKLPGTFKSIIGNENILIRITMTDKSTLYISAATNDAKLTKFEKIETPTSNEDLLTITSDEETIRSLIASDDPVKSLKDSMKSGKIRIENTGFLKGLVLWAIRNGLASIIL